MEQVLKEIPALIESIGFLQTAILFLMCVFAFVIAKEKIKGDTTTKRAASNMVAPITCAWGEIEREALRNMARKVAASEDRLKEVQQDLDRMRERQIEMHVIITNRR